MQRKLIIAVVFAIVAVGRPIAHAEPTPADTARALELLNKILHPVVTTEPPAQGTSPQAFDEDSLPADAQPTPMEGVAAVLAALNPQPGEVLVDYGCGFDARYLITACRLHGTLNAIGVEIVPEYAASARRYVEYAGLSDRIEIITGDATKLDVNADIGVAYMWPGALEQLRPKIEKLKRFVSYAYAVPGLTMNRAQVYGGGTLYIWNRPIPVPIVRTSQKTVSLPRGSYCQVCGRHCSNPMAHVLQQQIVGYRTVASPQAQPVAAVPRGHYVQQRVCDGHGHCHYERVFVPN